jgi:uncharacterized membrane protein
LIKLDWLVFALLSPAFWGLNNVVNKFLVTKKFQGYFSIVVYLNFLDMIFAGAVWVLTPVSLEFPYVLVAVGMGLIMLLAFWFYSKALMVEEVSRITPLFQMIPIFVVFLSVVFLDEILTAQKYLGIGLIVLTSLLISYRKTHNGNTMSSTLKLMVPFSVIMATVTVLNKYLLVYIDYWSVFFWMMTGSALGVLCMLAFPKPRKEFTETVSHLGTRTFFTSLFGEGTYILGTIFSLIATSMGYVSLVSALAGLQNFFVFVFMVILSIFVPKVLKEEISRNVLAIKIAAIALMFVGTWLVTV